MYDMLSDALMNLEILIEIYKRTSIWEIFTKSSNYITSLSFSTCPLYELMSWAHIMGMSRAYMRMVGDYYRVIKFTHHLLPK